MIDYDWRTASFTAVQLLTGTKILAENHRRVAISISADRTVPAANSGVAYLTLDVDIVRKVFTFNLPASIVLPWRDWGPVLEEVLYLGGTDIGATFVVTEVFRIH